jgi:hypothetical protein
MSEECGFRTISEVRKVNLAHPAGLLYHLPTTLSPFTYVTVYFPPRLSKANRCAKPTKTIKTLVFQ